MRSNTSAPYTAPTRAGNRARGPASRTRAPSIRSSSAFDRATRL